MPKVVIRGRKWKKDRQYNSKKKRRRKRTNKDPLKKIEK
jgi:hypothetical protein